MTALDRYFEAARGTLAEVAATQGDALEAAARLLADSVAGGGVLHLFGAGHSQLVTLDAFLRAGGLACVNPIVDPALAPAAGPGIAQVERTPGHAATVLRDEDLRPGEVVVVVSNSGVNPVPVEVALGCRERGLLVVALTNVEQAKATAARHPSGARRCSARRVSFWPTLVWPPWPSCPSARRRRSCVRSGGRRRTSAAQTT
mgnify:CR=1 FL=1